MKKFSLLILLIILFIFYPKTSNALSGIDVSEFQGDIDFNEVKDYGIEVVYIRSSAGSSYIDAKFKDNYQKAKEAGLNIGFYHYVTARTITEAKEQARFFANTISGTSPDCYLAMDFEVFTGLTKKEVNDISLAFLSTLEEITNKKAIIYSDAFNASRTFDRSLFNTYPLWIAEYDVSKPETTIPYLGWQFTDVGQIPGINTNVDRDIFEPSIILTDKTPIKKPTLKPEETKKVIYYRVKYGDTLSGIAYHYHVSLSSILKENYIPNPNLIFPNEVIKIITTYEQSISSTGNDTTYIVKRGNTLSYIARIYNVSVENLVTWNNIQNPNLIYPHEIIKIKKINSPQLIKYIVNTDIDISEIAKTYNTSIYELKRINKLKSNLLKTGQTIYIPETYILNK